MSFSKELTRTEAAELLEGSQITQLEFPGCNVLRLVTRFFILEIESVRVGDMQSMQFRVLPKEVQCVC